MFVIVKTRMRERDNAEHEQDDPKNHDETFHSENIIIVSLLVAVDVFEHTPAPEWRRGSADF